MLKYLVIQLDDTATSFCHYTLSKISKNPISLSNLRDGVLFAMKENLNIQFVYPDYALPKEYEEVIESIDHVKIVSSSCEVQKLKEIADIIVFNGWAGFDSYDWNAGKVYVLRTSKNDLFENYQTLKPILAKGGRLNIVITDIDTFIQENFGKYRQILGILSEELKKLYLCGQSPQVNLLTDRMMLKTMNNCNAGDETITLAPDGRFYVCPAFYYEQAYHIGSLAEKLAIRNPQLYKLSHAPLCRQCDAYQCKRCIWLNYRTTFEVNTPSHEQCVVAHLERNESHGLLENIRKNGEFMPGISIPSIDYLDPFEKYNSQ